MPCTVGADSISARGSMRQRKPLRRGQDPSLRFAVHGCHVGSGLDRSGHSPRSSPFPGTACRGRIYAARSCTVGADSISAGGSMRQRKPRGGVKTLGGAQRAPQPAKLARSCGCLPRRGKHCSRPGFVPLNRVLRSQPRNARPLQLNSAAPAHPPASHSPSAPTAPSLQWRYRAQSSPPLPSL